MDQLFIDEIYLAAKSNLAKIKMLATYNSRLYKDFPVNIPPTVEQHVEQDFRDLLLSVKGKSVGDTIETELIVDKLYAVGCMQAKMNFEQITDMAQKDFEQNIYHQEHIAYFAYMEAFFQDICRFIYTSHPELLASDKKISWEAIIQAGNYNTLINKLIETHLAGSGYNNLADIIEMLNRSPCQLKIRLNKEQLMTLRWSIATRNAIIHNNAKITKDLFERTTEISIWKQTKSQPDPIGSNLKLTDVGSAGLYLLLNDVIDAVYTAILGKYFTS